MRVAIPAPTKTSATTAATIAPPSIWRLALPRPDFMACSGPSSLPQVAPVPAPTLPCATGPSEAAAQALFPDDTPVGSRTFGDVFAALGSGAAGAAVVPVENTHAGSVVDVYDLLRGHADLQVIAEAVVRVRHCLLGRTGATLERITSARSHPQALAQVDDYLRARRIEPVVAYDTAGAAAEVAAGTDTTVAAVASKRAAPTTCTCRTSMTRINSTPWPRR